jgi:S-adenosylmethionine synthetase
LSIQHSDDYDDKEFVKYIKEEIIYPIIDKRGLNKDFKILINPSSRFVIGGPAGDCGLTGRKIVVDTYGGVGHHGGGAFSGKDYTKVDRSAAYMARYVCKNIVASGLADRCELQLAYAIGVPTPVSVFVDTFGTGKLPDYKIIDIIRSVFDLSVEGIIKTLDLKKPIYKQTSYFGHFGRNDIDLTWERLDKVNKIKKISLID